MLPEEKHRLSQLPQYFQYAQGPILWGDGSTLMVRTGGHNAYPVCVLPWFSLHLHQGSSSKASASLGSLKRNGDFIQEGVCKFAGGGVVRIGQVVFVGRSDDGDQSAEGGVQETS